MIRVSKITGAVQDAQRRRAAHRQESALHATPCRGVRGIYKIFTPRTVAVQDGEISVKQAAQILGIPADAIYNWLRHGQVPALVAGRWCIPWDPETQEVYRWKVASSFRLKPNPPAASVRATADHSSD